MSAGWSLGLTTNNLVSMSHDVNLAMDASWARQCEAVPHPSSYMSRAGSKPAGQECNVWQFMDNMSHQLM